MCLWLISVDAGRTKSMRVMDKVLKICISKLHLDLNISIKLNKMLIDEFVIFFSLHEPFEASFYEITFGRRPLR